MDTTKKIMCKNSPESRALKVMQNENFGLNVTEKTPSFRSQGGACGGAHPQIFGKLKN